MRRVTQIEIATHILGVLCTISGALLSSSVWPLVVGAWCGTIAKTLLTHAYLEGNSNHWSWNNKDLLELVHFGKWFFLSSTFGFLAIQGDRLLLGGLLDPTLFGVYVIAYQLFWTLEAGITRLVGNISFPALSEVTRNRRASLKTSLYQLHVIIGPMAYFYSGLVIVSGQVVIDLLYDNRYTQAGWMLKILGFGLLAAPFGTSASTLISIGSPKLFSNLSIIRAVALYLGAASGFYLFDVQGAVWGVVISYLCPVPLVVFYQIQHKLFDGPKELMLILALPVGMGAGSLFNLVVRHFCPWVL